MKGTRKSMHTRTSKRGRKFLAGRGFKRKNFSNSGFVKRRASDLGPLHVFGKKGDYVGELVVSHLGPGNKLEGTTHEILTSGNKTVFLKDTETGLLSFAGPKDIRTASTKKILGLS